ncbi:Acyltransferase [Apiospora marii]|uniref:Acyltransferase n=1 Tax=Apiospora marii TaxID=335849 RepID=A0ABR1SHZ2_9PEZI
MSPGDSPLQHVGLGYPGPRPFPEDGGDEANGIFSHLVRARQALSEASPWHILSQVLDFFKPAILRQSSRRRRSSSSSSSSRSDHPSTAWLDGLRGWAALSVCLAHMSVYTHPRIELCYGALIAPSPESNHPSLRNATPAAVPVLRLFWSGGHFAVMIFFVISGYVLSQRPIALLSQPLLAPYQQHKPADGGAFVDAVHSALTLFFATSWHVFGIATPWPEQRASLAAEWWGWARDLLKFCYFFRNRVLYTLYNIHTWTIPVELRGSYSILVWLFLWGHTASSSSPSACDASVLTRRRVMATAAMTFYLAVFAAGAWYAAFFAGMLTAEIDTLTSVAAASSDASLKDKTPIMGDSINIHHPRLPWDGLLDHLRQRPRLRSVLLHTMLAAGLYLGSEPSSDVLKPEELLGTCRGWKTLSRLIPAPYTASDEPESVHRWFWLFWAAWLLFVSIKEIDWARSLFETRFSQHLGKHSFPLYLSHGPLIALVSERLFYLTGVKRGPLSDDEALKFGHLMNRWRDHPRWWPLPRHPTPSAVDVRQPYPYGLEPEFLLCVALSLPVFLYAAELGTRAFDEPGVRAARWAYRRLRK